MMRRLFVGLLSCGILLASVAGTQAAVGLGDLGGALGADRYIVVLDNSARPGAVADRLSGQLGLEVGHVYRHALKGFSARISEASAEALEELPVVDFVERDRPVAAAGEAIPTGVARVNARPRRIARIGGLGRRVNADVAVIDTGIDLNHPDLSVRRGTNCTLFRGLLGVLPPEDDNGHGTHVAGTIGAKNNSTGVVGVAPGVRLWAVKVLSSLGTGSISDVICGIDWVTANSRTIEVVNMSIGGVGRERGNCGDAFHRAICRSVRTGLTYVAAAGNSHGNASGYVPAAYDQVIAVSALADFNGRRGGGARATCRSDVDDTFANFSNYGPDVDVIAPGVCIRSTWRNGGYATLSGTSMAAPHVAGAAVAYKARHPAASPWRVRRALRKTGTLNWTWPSEDKDGIQERLISVARALR